MFSLFINYFDLINGNERKEPFMFSLLINYFDFINGN